MIPTIISLFINRICFSSFLFLLLTLCLIDVDGGAERDNEGSSSSSSCYAPALIVPSTIPDDVLHHGNRVVIAHRGASAHLPEHSLPGYRLALELNADYIEPDLVPTSDGILIAVHSMDLNYTTDVEKKFPNRTSFSPYLNRTGYWSYDFTLEEIKELRIRQRLPTARSTVYDGMFTVPTFTEILELIHEWNTQIEPLRVDGNYSTTTTSSSSLDDNNSKQHIIQRRVNRGVYAELKDYPWLLEDKGIDLVDLFFRHIHDNSDLWGKAIFPNMCSMKRPKVYDFSIPPIVIQSFEGEALESFVTKWQSDDIVSSFSIKDDNSSSSSSSKAELPVPPLVLLVSHQDCLEEKFWFQVQDHWREHLSGIGPDKLCLTTHIKWRDFMERAEMLNLAVHPWTERPEIEFFLTSNKDESINNNIPAEESSSVVELATSLDEIIYLFCTVGVHGIFTESVDAAVLAANLDCPDAETKATTTTDTKSSSTSTTTTTSSNSGTCIVDGNTFFVGLVSFITGLIGAVIFTKLIPFCQRREKVPTSEDDVVDEIDLTDEDREML